MQCYHTGEIEAVRTAVHVDDKVFELALALAPYVQTLEVLSEGNGNIILPFRGGVLETIKMEIQTKLKKLIRFKKS